jgi:hypothetical protein
MRIVFGALSLLIVVAIVAVLAKKQLGAASPSVAASPATTQGVAVPTGTPQQQEQQVKQSVEKALQQSRPVDDDTK